MANGRTKFIAAVKNRLGVNMPYSTDGQSETWAQLSPQEMATHTVTDLLLEAGITFSDGLPGLIVDLVERDLAVPSKGDIERACRAYLSVWDEHKPDLPTAMRVALEAARSVRR